MDAQSSALPNNAHSAMQLQQLFPRWHARSTNPDVPWMRDVDLSREDMIDAILAAAANEQDEAL